MPKPNQPSSNNTSSRGFERPEVVNRGWNEQGDRWNNLGEGTGNGGAFRYDNYGTDGGYYYQNTDGSTYHHNGTTGKSTFTPPPPLLPSTPASSATVETEKSFLLPPLSYPYTGLEPGINKSIMQFHHDVHFASYIKNLNTALSSSPSLSKVLGDDTALQALLGNLDKQISDPATRKAVRNNGGGYLNHKLFFQQLTPGGTPLDSGSKLAAQVQKQFGGTEELKKAVIKEAMTLFGSGFVWMLKDRNGKLVLKQYPNQDNPAMDAADMTPVLACDCWEHAWYYQYGPKKGDYFEQWWKVMDWGFVAKAYE